MEGAQGLGREVPTSGCSEMITRSGPGWLGCKLAETAGGGAWPGQDAQGASRHLPLVALRSE